MYKELRFLWLARRLMMLYISMKFHENPLNGFQVMNITEQTRFRDEQTNKRTDIQGKKQYMYGSTPVRGRHKYDVC